ncbi:MAG TPA: alpha/beta hydrolase [Dehalococcoidia bacterium]|nr:alpha/beta hydrolase [Dehalococcoidia bacterium]
MPHVRLADCSLAFAERGAGPPLLLLMGLGGSHRSWGEPFLTALGRGFTLFALDHRGTGGSTRGTAPYTIAQLADDAAAALQALGLARAHVLGLSMGGMVAQELALRQPARLAGLVLASTTCGGPHAVWPGADGRRRFAEGLRLGESLWPAVVADEFAAANRPFLARIAFDTLAAGTPPSVFAEQARAIARFSTWERLPLITAPTLVLAGDGDRLIPPANARLIASRIRGAEGAFVRGTGHCFVWEAPERAAAEISRFLARRGQSLVAAPREPLAR